MLIRIALLAMAAPRRVLGAAVLVLIGLAAFGLPVANGLSGGGFQDPSSESARATRVLSEKFGESDQQLQIVVTAAGGAASASARQAGAEIAEGLAQSPLVFTVSSAWTSPPATAARLVSKDGMSGLIVANLKGGENNAQRYAKTLLAQFVHDRNGVTVRAGGVAMAYGQINQQTERDLLLMESIAFPLSFVALVWVFGGLIAAALPMALGAVAIAGAMSVLRLISFGTDVSIYALNVCIALGLALAIDYTLLIITRYRDEVADGRDRDAALIRAMSTAGRTVLFSAATVALSMAVMVLFPGYFLKSFAYGGVAIVAFAAVAAIVVTPAAIALLGARLDSLDVRRLVRRVRRRDDAPRRPAEQMFWYRSTMFVMRHTVPMAMAVVALLIVLGSPFLGVRWGFPDERMLPRSASSHDVGDRLRNDFAGNLDAAVSVVIPDAHGLSARDLDTYAAELSRVPDVSAVTAPTATFAAGKPTGPPAAPSGFADGSALLSVATTAPLYSDASAAQLDRLHAVAGPAGRSVEFAGLAQNSRDSVAAITSRLPLVLGLIAMVTFALLFLLTGSVILPLKALVLNILSLTAAFGALVWIFQDAHLGALGTTPTGTLVFNVPVLLFCIAFGLSMDYEVFLISRIREHWLASARTGADNDGSVALGLARTGRVITAAALLMSISFSALIAAQVSFMRMFGLGLTLAVLTDATLVRMVLVPALMHIMGRANWWSPRPLAWLHAKFGISESRDIDHSAAVAGAGRG